MNTDKTTTATAKTRQPDFVKRIGKTTYKVNVHFSTTSKETINDKIIRMLKNEVQKSPKM
jgi:3-hydroxy-3-methylglutaryl CoA synthase